jgi:hypothetical protein
MLEPETTTNSPGATPAPTDPPPPAAKPVVVVGTPEWDELTARRAVLIYKKNREGLSDAESTEFERLQAISRAAIAAACPRPDISAELAALEKHLGPREGWFKK